MAGSTAREPRQTRRARRIEGRRARHLDLYMAATTSQQRLERAWDWLRSVVAEKGEPAAHEAAHEIRRLAERLEKGPRK